MNNLKKKGTPLISIIVPTYNHANFIEKAIISVKNQTYKNWELIVIDNFSKDNTNKILENFKDKRIKYHKFKNYGIIAKSRNFGIKISKGEWIAFLDSDDYWIENKLEICAKYISKKVDFIYHDLESVYLKKQIFKKKIIGRSLKKPILKDLLISTISKGTAIANSSAVVRKKILIEINGINENKKLMASEDYNTWLRVAQITDNFKYIKMRLGFFLIHEGSTQKKKNLSIPQREAVLDFLNLLNKKQRLKLEVKLKYLSGSFNFLLNKKNTAVEDLLFVFKYGSFDLKLKSLLKIISLYLYSLN